MTHSEKIQETKKRYKKYLTQRALRLIRRHEPKNLLEASKLGIGVLVYVDEGAFRKVYRLKGTDLLIKFERNTRYHHTRSEVRKIMQLRELKFWRKHTPPVYYFNDTDGVLVTKFFRKSTKERQKYATYNFISKLIWDTYKVRFDDLYDDNVHLSDDKNLVFTDLGY